MEDNGAMMMTDNNSKNKATEVAKHDKPQRDVNVNPKQDTSSAEGIINIIDPSSAEDVALNKSPQYPESAGEFNMEATINADDVIRAGGFGARDDLSSFLPVASDSTDFEASLLDARDYEEPQGEQRRPGLGWNEDRKSE